LDIVERKGGDIAGTQTVGGHNGKDRVISFPDGTLPVDGTEKCLNGCPRQGTGELLLPVNARRVNLACQPGRNNACCSQKTEEVANRCNRLLEGHPAHSLAEMPDETFDISAAQRGQAIGLLLKLKPIKKLSGKLALSSNRAAH
jgi:hypothetical protein